MTTSKLFLSLMIAFFAIAVIQQFFEHSRRSQRRVYWTCMCAGAVAGILAGYPDLHKGLGLAALVVGAMTMTAYFYTPYIKIRGKIYALSVQDSRPDPEDVEPSDQSSDPFYDPAPDAYSGLLTASKMWWIVVILMAMSSVLCYAFARGEMDVKGAAIGVGFLLFLSITSGLGDASWGYGIARGQRVQFGIASVITGGAFAALYLAAYYVGKRKPLRRTQSMEYRAHPRHRRTPE